VDAFLARHAASPLTDEDRTRALGLLEMERHGMLMFTSCGWFFDDIGGIEAVQVLRYAARHVELGEQLLGLDLSATFLERLATAKSNRPQFGDGRGVFEARVRPSMADLEKVAAHYAISSLFGAPDTARDVYCYHVQPTESHLLESEGARLATGRLEVRSRVTWEQARIAYGVLHTGGNDLAASARKARGEAAFRAFRDQVGDAFQRGAFSDVLAEFEGVLGHPTYSLKSLFRDEQREIVLAMVAPTVEEVEGLFADVYAKQAPLLADLAALRVPPPNPLVAAARAVLSRRMANGLRHSPPDLQPVGDALAEAHALGIRLDRAETGNLLRQRIEDAADAVGAVFSAPEEAALLADLESLLALAGEVDVELNLRKPQTDFWRLLHSQAAWLNDTGDPRYELALAVADHLGLGWPE
jgi:hypothetical protein